MTYRYYWSPKYWGTPKAIFRIDSNDRIELFAKQWQGATKPRYIWCSYDLYNFDYLESQFGMVKLNETEVVMEFLKDCYECN